MPICTPVTVRRPGARRRRATRCRSCSAHWRRSAGLSIQRTQGSAASTSASSSLIRARRPNPIRSRKTIWLLPLTAARCTLGHFQIPGQMTWIDVESVSVPDDLNQHKLIPAGVGEVLYPEGRADLSIDDTVADGSTSI